MNSGTLSPNEKMKTLKNISKYIFPYIYDFAAMHTGCVCVYQSCLWGQGPQTVALTL